MASVSSFTLCLSFFVPRAIKCFQDWECHSYIWLNVRNSAQHYSYLLQCNIGISVRIYLYLCRIVNPVVSHCRKVLVVSFCRDGSTVKPNVPQGSAGILLTVYSDCSSGEPKFPTGSAGIIHKNLHGIGTASESMYFCTQNQIHFFGACKPYSTMNL